MNVTATRRGFYGGVIRSVGEAFDLADKDDFSENWMAAEAGEKPAKPKPQPKPKQAEAGEKPDEQK